MKKLASLLLSGALALGLLSIGGLGVAKIFGNFSGALMALPSILLTICWLKIIKRDGNYLLCNYVEPECHGISMIEEEGIDQASEVAK